MMISDYSTRQRRGQLVLNLLQHSRITVLSSQGKYQQHLSYPLINPEYKPVINLAGTKLYTNKLQILQPQLYC